MQASQLLVVLLLGGLLGMTGQGIRVIAGIKKRHDEAAQSGRSIRETFDSRTLAVSLLIGFVAGALAIIALWNSIDPDNLRPETAATLLGAGYAGTDLIEAFMYRSSKLPNINQVPAQEACSEPPAIG